MQHAVELARAAAKPGDIIILSPASASFDLYPNFEVRGREFKNIVNALQVITQVRTPRQRQRFRSACRGKLCLGVTMPQALALFGKSQPGRFFAGPTLALDVGGSTAWLRATPTRTNWPASCISAAVRRSSWTKPSARRPPAGPGQSPILSLA